MSQWASLERPPLRQLALRTALTGGPRPAWRAIEVVAETGSTNADLAARARDGEPEGLVRTTDLQNAGRGRRDRTWTTPPRASIAVSVLLRPAVPQSRWAWLSPLAGVAVTDALTQVCGLAAVLKWPNDVLLPTPDGHRKAAGILAEIVPSPTPAVVLGIGMNVSQGEAELPVPAATSLLLAGAATTDRDTVLRAILRALSVRYRAWQEADGDPRASGVAAPYRERCVTIGQQVRVHLPDGSALDGAAEGVDDEGRLLVRDAAARTHELAAGDVVHVRPPEPA